MENTLKLAVASAAQPTLLSLALNGRPALRFDGTSDYLTFTLPVNGLTTNAGIPCLSGRKVSTSPAPLAWGLGRTWASITMAPLRQEQSGRELELRLSRAEAYQAITTELECRRMFKFTCPH